MPKVKKKSKVRNNMSELYTSVLSNLRNSEMPIASSSPVQIQNTPASNAAKIYAMLLKDTKLEYKSFMERYKTTTTQILQILPEEVVNCYPSICNLDQGESGIDIIDSLILDNVENENKKRGRPKRPKVTYNDKLLDHKMEAQNIMTPIRNITNHLTTTVNLTNRFGNPLLLRKPNMEEMVISLHGTPIKATTDTSRDVELTIPVGDGKVISLLPNEELVGKTFPQLDAATMSKLCIMGKILDSITHRN